MNYGPAHFHEDGSEAQRIILRQLIHGRTEKLGIHMKHFSASPKASQAILSLKSYDGRPALRAVLAATLEATGVSENDFMSPRRQQRLARARFVFYFLAYELTQHGTPAIGQFAGRRDHSTVLNGLRNIEKRPKTFRAMIEAAKEILGRGGTP